MKKCLQCQEPVSASTVYCPKCDSLVADGNTAFKRRIEEYGAQGYNLRNHSGNTAEMSASFWTAAKNADLHDNILFWLLQTKPFIALQMIILFGGVILLFYRPLLALIPAVIIAAAVTLLVVQSKKNSKVTITLTEDGKITERGCVLKSSR